MSADLFVLASLGALLVFILWESWRSRPSALARRAKAANGFLPGGSSREIALLVLAAVFLACGVLALYAPNIETAGRSARLFGMLEALLGVNVLPAFFFVGAIAAFIAAVAVRRKRAGVDHLARPRPNRNARHWKQP